MDKSIKYLGATGVASTAAVMAASVPAVAGEVYFGVSAGVPFGPAPYESVSSYPEDYGLAGIAGGMFIGMMTDVGNLKVGGEVAFTPRIEGDPDENSEEYGYDITGMIDTKLRLGAMVGDVLVYGFAGFSMGRAWTGWGDDYSADGMNFGFGAEMDVGTNMFVGAEVIQRNIRTHGYYTTDTVHHVVSLRGGFKF